ncbi:uncharacterized protein (DUF305 family) [Actinoplanes italicus]|uniref:Uncharacterized protein (DUF305 family) n=1 Tax=Actinoplanes italicus TaxID=113567 RepID=A0A2T0KJW7_9ACTN|nr:uncharacterized protein (DUF305 family) [Actinoplanes italicus]
MIRTMSRRALVGGALILTFAASGCGGGHGSGHSSGTGSTPVSPAASGAVFNETDVAFAQHMVVHHQQAVEMSTLAPERAGTEVKELAAKISAAQGPEIATMTGFLAEWGQPAPETAGHGAEHATMPGMMSEEQMAKLAASSGPAFDELFLTMMIDHHAGAITMAQGEIDGGVDPEAKALASKIVADQRAEIAVMQAMR